MGAIANIYNSTIWGIREVFVGICAVCAPGIRPLFVKDQQTSTVFPGATVLKERNSASSGSHSQRSARETNLEKMGITLTHETGSRDSIELALSPPATDQPNRESFTTTRPRLRSSYQPQYSPRSQFFRKTPLSVIHSESESRMSTLSIRTSVLNRASLHPPPEVLTVNVAEPLQVYVRNETGLQHEIETSLPHIYHRGEDIDLEKRETVEDRLYPEG